MALIEIDGFPINSMVDLSMAMLVITRWYIWRFPGVFRCNPGNPNSPLSLSLEVADHQEMHQGFTAEVVHEQAGRSTWPQWSCWV